MTEQKEEQLDSWALLELFGHQKIVGRAKEASLAGGAFIRVDVPEHNGQPAFTRFFSPGAIYSISPVSEAVARKLLDHYRNEPVTEFTLRALPPSKEVEPDEAPW